MTSSPSRAALLGSIGKRIAAATALDVHVLATLVFRAWALVAGVVTIALIPSFMRKEEQGYYFTFSSLISLQIFFELGFNYVVAQLVSHEVALLEAARGSAAQRHAERLASLLRLSSRWYRIMAIAFAAAVLAGGFVFFDGHHTLARSAWLGPWVLLSAGAAVNLYFSPFLAIAEGAGRFADVSRLRLRQSVVGYGSMWLLLAAGAGLWAATAVPVWAGLLSGAWIRRRTNLGLPAACFGPPGDHPGIDWKSEILPLQWRIAVSWMSGYFIFQLFNPFIFANQGAVAAGRTGLALAAYTAILGLGMSWINAKAPTFSGLIARGERAELNASFKRILLRSTAFTTLASIGFVGLTQLLKAADVPVASRIADLPILLLLGGTTIVNTVIAGLAIYMRCHKEEPMLPNSVVVGALTAVAVATGSRIGVTVPFACYFAITAAVSLPWCVLLFTTYWRRR